MVTKINKIEFKKAKDGKIELPTGVNWEDDQKLAIQVIVQEWTLNRDVRGILPSILNDNVGATLGREDASRQIDTAEIASYESIENAVNEASFFSILEERSDKDYPNNNSIFGDYHFLNEERKQEILFNVKLEIQPVFSQVKQNRHEGGHYRQGKTNKAGIMQIKEAVLQPNNWLEVGLMVAVHEKVHNIADYLGISDSSDGKDLHNKQFQALAISMGLKTFWDEDKRHCSTTGLADEFFSWLEKNFDMKQLEKIFSHEAVEKVSQPKKRIKNIVIDTESKEVFTFNHTTTKNQRLIQALLSGNFEIHEEGTEY